MRWSRLRPIRSTARPWRPGCFRSSAAGGLAAIFDAVNLLTPARIETQAALWDEALAAFGPDIAAVHVKDAVVKDGALAPALLGEGVMCYDNIMRWLAQHKPGVALLREEIAPETAARDLAVMRAWAGR